MSILDLTLMIVVGSVVAVGFVYFAKEAFKED
jgi:hypothetical protein